MSSLDKITSFNDLDNITKLDPIEVGPRRAIKTRTKEHNQKISASLKRFNKSDRGKAVQETKSAKMKSFYTTTQGRMTKEKLSATCGRYQPKAVSRAIRKHIANEYKSGKKIAALAQHYNVSRTSIYRYIKEFS